MDLDSRGSTGSFWEGSATSDESNYLNAAFIVTGVMRSWWIRTSTEQTAEPQLYVFTILVAEEKGGGKTLWDSISKQLIRRLWLAGEIPIDYYGIMEGWFCSNL